MGGKQTVLTNVFNPRRRPAYVLSPTTNITVSQLGEMVRETNMVTEVGGEDSLIMLEYGGVEGVRVAFELVVDGGLLGCGEGNMEGDLDDMEGDLNGDGIRGGEPPLPPINAETSSPSGYYSDLVYIIMSITPPPSTPPESVPPPHPPVYLTIPSYLRVHALLSSLKSLYALGHTTTSLKPFNLDIPVDGSKETEEERRRRREVMRREEGEYRCDNECAACMDKGIEVVCGGCNTGFCKGCMVCRTNTDNGQEWTVENWTSTDLKSSTLVLSSTLRESIVEAYNGGVGKVCIRDPERLVKV